MNYSERLRLDAESAGPSPADTSAGALLMWGIRNGLDASALLSHAVWSAVLAWTKPTLCGDAVAAVELHQKAALARVCAYDPVPITDEDRKLASDCREQWKLDGSPRYGEFQISAREFAEANLIPVEPITRKEQNNLSQAA